MYRWNKKHINDLIKYLDDIKIDSDDYYDCLNILNAIKNGDDTDYIGENLHLENEEYETLKKQNPIINPIIEKYFKENVKDSMEYKKIYSSKKNNLLFTRDNIKNINPKWSNILEPYIFSENYVDFKRNNDNYIYYLKYIGKYFISLSKENNITDFLNPIHEFLHIYSTILNPKSFDAIEYEFLSILGELITTFEMRKKSLFNQENIKYDINSFISILNYIKTIVLKKQVIFDKIDSDKKINYLVSIFKISKKSILRMYDTSLEYDYSTIISYFLALELFDLYIKDKEKCVFTCEKIITSNDELEKKLKDNNISLLEHGDDYIKQLKKSIYR